MFFRIACTLVLLFISQAVFAVRDTNIRIEIEEPFNGDVKTGISAIRGWAVTSWTDAPIVEISMSLDDGPTRSIPYGGTRNDVCNGFPGFPRCGQSGFSMAMNFSNLPTGQHVLYVRATDSFGDFNDTQVNFDVVRFDTSYIGDSDNVDFYASQVSLKRDSNGNIHDKRIYLENVYADGFCYDLILNWSGSIQGWRVEDINPILSSWCE